jgi:GT2 family glycosyltransferase
VATRRVITVSIATLDRLPLLRRTLDAFFENTTLAFELFVIDNGSKDGTREYLGSEVEGREGVTIVRNDKNRGVAFAVNQGWSGSSHQDYVVKLDDDILVPPRWDEELAEMCDRIPNAGCVGINFEGVDYPEVEMNGLRVQDKQGILGGACVMIPGRVFKQLGYWNECLPRIGHEDADMGLRVLTAGLKCLYHPDLHRRGAEHLAEDREHPVHDSEYVYLKYLAQRTNFWHFVRFANYYRTVSEGGGRAVAIYMEHAEDESA